MVSNRHRRGDLARQCLACRAERPVTSRPLEVGFCRVWRAKVGASEWGSRPERIECPDGSGLVGNERKRPARRRCGNMGGTGPEGRQSCSILLADNELSFDISKQNDLSGQSQVGTNMARCRRHCTRIPPIKKRSPGRPLCRLLFRCGSGQGIGPEGVARICVPRVSIDQGNASGRKLARICGTRGRGRSLSPPRAPGGAGVGHGWGEVPASSCLVAWPIW
jgi:hypothetical protein